MFVHTCFNNRSNHGYKSSILKSGICKYYRRDEPERFTWCVMEMSLFHTCEKGNTIITNLINRLKILLMEDISPMEIIPISKGIEILNEYEMNRDKPELLLDFCNMVLHLKRNRSVSYINNWWRETSIELELQEPSGKSKKYKKPNDTDELMLLGDNLIHYLETNDERIFDIYNKMYKMEPMGLRFRRKDAVYLYWEIIADYIICDKSSYQASRCKCIYDFALQMFHKKNMTERSAFAIWIGVIVWKTNHLSYEDKIIKSCSKEDCDKYYESMETLEIDDYVINDYHVNRGHGLGHFAENGAFVKNEDLSFLDNPNEYKQLYIDVKKKKDLQTKNSKKNTHYKQNTTNHNKKVLPKYADKEFISWDLFSNVRVLQEGVCGGKVCCILVTYKDEKYILKEMKESMNYGRDYIVLDKCKKYFKLKRMNMKLIVSNKGLEKIDPNHKSFVNNWKIGDHKSVYCMMDYFENIGDIGKHKHLLSDDNPQLMYECLKIRLYDGLFMTSDNIQRNILVNDRNELLSIDENDIFGKRKNIFNKYDICKKFPKELFNKVMNDLLDNKDEKLRKINRYLSKHGFDHIITPFKERFNTYESIVYKEVFN